MRFSITFNTYLNCGTFSKIQSRFPGGGWRLNTSISPVLPVQTCPAFLLKDSKTENWKTVFDVSGDA
jgi:hypothetical protein